MMRPTFMVAFITNAIGSFKIYTEPNLLLSQNYDPSMKVAPYINLIINSMSGGSSEWRGSRLDSGGCNSGSDTDPAKGIGR